MKTLNTKQLFKVTKSCIRHNGKRYMPGDTIELEADEANRLEGLLEPIETPAVPTKGKNPEPVTPKADKQEPAQPKDEKPIEIKPDEQTPELKTDKNEDIK